MPSAASMLFIYREAIVAPQTPLEQLDLCAWNRDQLERWLEREGVLSWINGNVG
jgi:hypothetical protein